MKLLSLTICCFILRARSQLSFQQLNYPKYQFTPLDANSDQIYFEDQLARNPESSRLNVRQETTQNGNEQYSQTGEQQAFNVQPSAQQVLTPSVSVPNPANFNVWNKEPVSSSQATVIQNSLANRNQDVTGREQASVNQNQGASNVNSANLNQNSFSSQNENLPGNLDLSIFEDNSGQKPVSTVNSPVQAPINQEIQGIFGQSQDAGTLNSVKPKIDFIGAAVTHFGINFLKIFGNLYDGNTVISPFSISTCLALLQQGARGTTQSQINNALLLNPEASRSVYKEIGDDIKKRNSINILRKANNIFMAKSFAFNATFSSIAQTEFESTVSTLDYSKPTQAAAEINKWVADQTNNKIKMLVTPGDVGVTTQMTLVNAIYFKGLWDITFNEAKTKLREFHLSNGQKKMVPFMRSRRNLKGGIEPASKAKIMILPFKNEEYSLMWILPSQESNINDLIQSLTAEQLLEFRDFPSQEFDVEVPKFTIRRDTNLIPILKNMGISEMFGPFADLSGIGGNRVYSSSLQVSSAVHSAVLSIDEHGGTGAGATSFGVVALSYDSPLKFKADRPFLVVLWDNASAVPLFMAKILEPLEDTL